MQSRKFHPFAGQAVWISRNVTEALEPKHFREPQIIEGVSRVPVKDVEDGYVYSVYLKDIPIAFTEFDLEPIRKATSFAERYGSTCTMEQLKWGEHECKK